VVRHSRRDAGRQPEAFADTPRYRRFITVVGLREAVEGGRADPGKLPTLAQPWPDRVRRNHSRAQDLELLETSYFS